MLNKFEECYHGEYRTLEYFVEYTINDFYHFGKLMRPLSYYFRFMRYGFDLECGYYLEDGYVFRSY